MNESEKNENIEYEKEQKFLEKKEEFYKSVHEYLKKMEHKNFLELEKNVLLENEPSLCKIIKLDKNLEINKIDKDDLQKFQDYVEDELIFKMMPKDIYISTMTVTCKMNDMKFNCENIARYLDLSHDDIQDIICAYEDIRKNVAEKKIIYRSIPYTNKKKSKKKDKHKEVFYNQVSIHTKIKTKNDPVHIKLFKNGSIQITGCQSGNDILEILLLMINKLKITKSIIDEKEKKIIEKPFVCNIEKLNVNNIENLKVNMINTNFVIPFRINLEELYKLLTLTKIECRYDKLSHSCVNVKYNHPEKKVSIFVFEKGSIVITGAKTGEQVKLAYDYIYKFLLSNYKAILKKTVNLNNIKIA